MCHEHVPEAAGNLTHFPDHDWCALQSSLFAMFAFFHVALDVCTVLYIDLRRRRSSVLVTVNPMGETTSPFLERSRCCFRSRRVYCFGQHRHCLNGPFP